MGRLEKIEKLLYAEPCQDWVVLRQQIKKLRERLGCNYSLGIASSNTLVRAEKGLPPTEREIEHAPEWRKRAAAKLKYLENGGDPEEFRIYSKKHRASAKKKSDESPVTEEELSKRLYDLLYADLLHKFTKAAIKNDDLTLFDRGRLELCRILIRVYPELDQE